MGLEGGVDRPLEDVDSIKGEGADALPAVKADECAVHEPDVDLEGVGGPESGGRRNGWAGPLLELLDRSNLTRRVDDLHRRVVDGPRS
jgi:hypothetical protein